MSSVPGVMNIKTCNKALKEEGLFSRYILVCNEDYAQTTEDGIEIVPWRQFLDELWAGKII